MNANRRRILLKKTSDNSPNVSISRMTAASSISRMNRSVGTTKSLTVFKKSGKDPLVSASPTRYRIQRRQKLSRHKISTPSIGLNRK